jgi:MFS family permease
MDTAGAITGVLLALGLLAWLSGEYRTLFALTALPGAFAVLLTFRIREPSQTQERGSAPLLPLSALPSALWRACVVMWIFALGNPSQAFLLLRAQGHGASDSNVVGLYLLMNVVYALVALPAGRLSDRLGRTRVIALGWCVYAASFAAFGLLEESFLWPIFALYGAHLGLTQGAAKAWISDHAPAELRGTALGLYQLGLGVALLTSSVLAGVLWDHLSHAAPFVVGAGFALLALALLPWANTGRR